MGFVLTAPSVKCALYRYYQNIDIPIGVRTENNVCNIRNIAKTLIPLIAQGAPGPLPHIVITSPDNERRRGWEVVWGPDK